MRRWSLALAAAGAAAVVAMSAPLAAAASSTRPAYVVNAQGAPLRSGAAGTVFGITLPQGAACPADTEHHGYLIYSYVLPASDAVTALTFPDGFPGLGEDLITSQGEPYVTSATEPDSGDIPTLPLFSWSRYDHQDSTLPPGSYDVGIACAVNQGRVVRYWNTTVVFATDSTGGLVWSVHGAVATTKHSHLWLVIVLVAVVVLVGPGAYLVLRLAGRRRTSSAATL